MARGLLQKIKRTFKAVPRQVTIASSAYHLHRGYDKKSDALKVASKLRGAGYKARVKTFPFKDGFWVYTKPATGGVESRYIYAGVKTHL